MKAAPMVFLAVALALAAPPAHAEEAPPVGVMGRAGPPPPEVAKPGPEPFSRSLGASWESAIPTVTLGAVDVDSLLAQDAEILREERFLRTGVVLEVTVRMAGGRWWELPGEGWLWTVDVAAPGAKAMRVHFDVMVLPEGAQVIAYAPDRPDLLSGPYEGRGPLGDGTLWTQPVPGERIRVECFVPGAARPKDDLFLIDAATHAYRDLFDEGLATMAHPTDCWLDVMCYPAWLTASHAVGRLDRVQNRDSGFCTGQLLNATNGDLTPYLLTANHCLSTPAAAQSTWIRWFYQTPGCDGTPPNPLGVAASGGCTLLAHNASSDFTFLMVDGTLPGGLYWAGWYAGAVSTGTAVTCIQHPLGSWKRISFGSTVQDRYPNFTTVQWSDGVTDHGSSGSGLLLTGTQQLIGQLQGGASYCDVPPEVGLDHYGKFSATYPSIAGYLAGGSDDALEPNDLCATSRSIGTGYYPGLVVKSVSPDWYAVYVPNNVHVRVALSFQHAWGDIDAQLYDGCGGAVVAGSYGSSNTELLDYTNTGADRTFYVRIYLFSDTRNEYTMNVYTADLANLDPTDTPYGFTSPVVPRNANDAAYGYVWLTPVLDGNVFHTWINCSVQSEGPATAPAFTSRLDLDESEWLTNLSWPEATPGSVQKYNIGTAIMRGGRHTIVHTVDPDNLVGESNEGDNVWRGQWVWSPYVLADQTLVSRSVPPDRGLMTDPNCDGFQLTGNWWGGVAICPTSPDDDYDVALYDDYADSQTGFSHVVAGSADWAGETDFVLFNGNVLGYMQTRWAGVTAWEARYGGDFVVHPSNQTGPTYYPGTAYGDSLLVAGTLAANEIMRVTEVYLGSPTTTYGFRLHPTAGTADLNLALYAAADDYMGKGDYLAVSENAGTADDYLQYQPASAGYYALVVWKRGWEDLAAESAFSLTLGPALPNLTAGYVPEGWSAPVVPRNAGDATAASALLPPTLPGDAAGTWTNWAILVQAGNPTPGWSSDLLLDGISGMGSARVGELGPTTGTPITFINVGPWTVTGGRHTLTAIADGPATLPELDEDDNVWSTQYVWSPLLRAREDPVVRPAPPPMGVFPDYNCDGYEIQRDPWAAWVVSEAALGPDDYDLVTYDDYVGSTSGFSHEVGGSTVGWNSTDFVVGHYEGTPTTVYPGVTEYGGTRGAYVFDWSDATGRNGDNEYTPLVLFADQVMAPFRLANVYEGYFVSGVPYFIDLVMSSGTPNLLLAVYSGESGGIWGRQQYSALATAVGANRDTLQFLAPIDGYYPLVVFRPDGSDVTEARYTLSWRVAGSTDVPPGEPGAAALVFVGARPNPIVDRGALEFALPGAARVRLSVYDLAGRRVRTLADGPYPAGRHAIDWDGRGDDAVRLAAGVYLARLEVGGRVVCRRVALLR